MQRQAFRQVARADADRIEALQHRERLVHGKAIRTQPRSDFVEIGAQIARFVHRIDQRDADQTLVGVQRRDGKLAQQIILEAGAVGDRRFQQILVALKALRGLDGRPVGQRLARHGGRRRLLAFVVIVAR